MQFVGDWIPTEETSTKERKKGGTFFFPGSFENLKRNWVVMWMCMKASLSSFHEIVSAQSSCLTGRMEWNWRFPYFWFSFYTSPRPYRPSSDGKKKNGRWAVKRAYIEPLIPCMSSGDGSQRSDTMKREYTYIYIFISLPALLQWEMASLVSLESELRIYMLSRPVLHFQLKRCIIIIIIRSFQRRLDSGAATEASSALLHLFRQRD